MKCVQNDSPGLWEALHGLNVKSLSLGKRGYVFDLNHKELFWRFLSSLAHLEKLSIKVDFDIPSLCKALHGRNINYLSLRWSWKVQDLTVNNLKLLSQSLSSLLQLTTLSVCVDGDSTDLWKALCGLNISSLSLGCALGGLTVAHEESLSQSLSSLTQLETLSIDVYENSPGLWVALLGLNIRSLSLIITRGGGTGDHVEPFSQSLSSLTQLETLSIDVYEDSPGLWEALRGLNIKSLSLRITRTGGTVNHLEPLSQSLSSLTQLETLSIDVYADSPGLLEAFSGLYIKSLSLRLNDWTDGLIMYLVETPSQYRLSLNELESLSIDVDCDIPSLWDALRGLNVNNLSLRVKWRNFNHVESISQSLSSLIQLETVSICWDKFVLWEVLCGLKIKSLRLDFLQNLGENNVYEFLSQVLSSLTRLETLCISVDIDSPILWEAFRGLHIKSLSLSGRQSRGLIVNHVEPLSQSLSSLRQLETLSICISEQRPGLWGALCGLNIKRLSLSGFYRVNNVELLSNSLSSLTQLKTLCNTVRKDSPSLWEALSGLNIKSLSVSNKLNGLRVKN
ncbi:hypothetical protein DPMN_166812 [Dreissena polymorpha]|uniref:Uncharacterized protein n=1 Tax=Dreissena polymorpha TaxID=45954 RepID=A0A9D4EXN9_DREPO|nr:hypothetical protein DPMN_166812 [Dreissena polymorpha]